MSRLKVIMNRKNETELQENREIGWDSRFHVSKSPVINKLSNSNSKDGTFLPALNKVSRVLKANPIEVLAKPRVKSNMGIKKIPHLNNANFLNQLAVINTSNTPKNTKNSVQVKERKIQSSSKIKIQQTEINNKLNHLGGIDNINSVHVNQHPQNEVMTNISTLNTLNSLWDETAVTTYYRNQFKLNLESYDSLTRNKFILQEILNLKKIKEKVVKLNNEINARDKTLELLGKFDKILSNEKLAKEVKENNFKNHILNDSRLISDITTTLHHLRVLSLSIVNHFVEIKKNLTYYYPKFEDFLHQHYSYLIKMKYDSDFLASSNLNKIFSFSKSSDPFLRSLKINRRKNGNEIESQNIIESEEEKLLNIDEETEKNILTCNFILMELSILSDMGDSRLLNESRLSSKKSEKNLTNHNVMKRHKELKPLNPLKLRTQNNNNNIIVSEGSGKSPSPNNKMVNSSINRKKVENGHNEKSFVTEENKLVNKNKSISANIPISPITQVDSVLNDKNKEIDERKDNTVDTVEIEPQFTIKDNKNFPEKKITKVTNIDKEEEINLKNNVTMDFNNINKDNLNKDNLIHVKEYDATNPRTSNKDDKTVELLKKMDEALQVSCSVEDNLSLNLNLNKITTTSNQIDAHKNIKFENSNTNPPNINNHQCQFEFLTDNLNDFQFKYDELFSNINVEQKTAFKIQPLITNYLKGSFPKIILIKNSNLLTGIASVYFENSDNSNNSNNLNNSNSNVGLKLNIASFCTLYYEEYEIIFKEFYNFICTKLSFDEVCISLHHALINDSYVLNDYIKTIITKKSGFKWLTLENTGSERITKYKKVNLHPKENISNSIICKKDHLNFNTLAIIELSENLSDTWETEENLNEVNSFPLTCILCEMIHNFDYKVKNEQYKKLNIEKLKKYTKNFMTIGGSDLEGIKSLLKDSGDFFSPDEVLFSCEYSIKVNFDRVSSVKMNGIIYNRITTDVDILLHPSGRQYYLLKCQNENFSLFIGEYDRENITNNNFNINSESRGSRGSTGIQQKISNENINLFNYCLKIYTELEQSKENATFTTKTVYIPAYNFSNTLDTVSPSLMNELDIYNEEDRKVKVSKLHYQMNNHFVHDSLPLFCLPPDTSDIILSKDFFIGLIHLDLLSELNIPLIHASLVREKNFQKFEY